MQPGWYADPWHAGGLRWWDGLQWTPHSSPVPAHGRYRPELGREQIARERQMFKLAYGIVVLLGVLWAVRDLLDATIIGDKVRHSSSAGIGIGIFPSTTWPVWDGLVLWVVSIPFLLWLRRAAIAAEAVSYPARRHHNWAFWGFLVPVVSLWFPYLSAVDCFAPGDPRRRVAGHWWGWFLAQQFLPEVILLVAQAGRGPALIVAIAGLTCPVLATYFGLKMMRAIDAAHGELVSG